MSVASVCGDCVWRVSVCGECVCVMDVCGKCVEGGEGGLVVGGCGERTRIKGAKLE